MLYDLIILTFSAHGKLADLVALSEKSGLSSEDFDQVVQYSAQACIPCSGRCQLVKLFSSYKRFCTTW